MHSLTCSPTCSPGFTHPLLAPLFLQPWHSAGLTGSQKVAHHVGVSDCIFNATKKRNDLQGHFSLETQGCGRLSFPFLCPNSETPNGKPRQSLASTLPLSSCAPLPRTGRNRPLCFRSKGFALSIKRRKG